MFAIWVIKRWLLSNPVYVRSIFFFFFLPFFTLLLYSAQTIVVHRTGHCKDESLFNVWNNEVEKLNIVSWKDRQEEKKKRKKNRHGRKKKEKSTCWGVVFALWYQITKKIQAHSPEWKTRLRITSSSSQISGNMFQSLGKFNICNSNKTQSELLIKSGGLIWHFANYR